jgi:hypothetical protein
MKTRRTRKTYPAVRGKKKPLPTKPQPTDFQVGDIATRWVRSCKARTNKIERLRAERNAIDLMLEKIHGAGRTRFVDKVLEPIAKVIAAKLGLTYAISGPYGLCCEYYVEFKSPQPPEESDEEFEDRVGHLSLSFVNSNNADRTFYLRDYSQMLSNYAPGTIGAANGMNWLSVVIPDTADAQWFIDWMNGQRDDLPNPEPEITREVPKL